MSGTTKNSLLFPALVPALVLLPLFANSQNAFAEWTGGIEAGTQLGSGENPTLRFFARNNSNPLSHFVYLDWTRENSSSSYRLGYNPEYNFSSSLYSFGRFSVEEDAVSVVERQLDALVGVGSHLHRTRDSLLTLEAGAGGQRLEFTDGREEQTDGFLYLGAKYHQTFFDRLRFNAFVDSRTGDAQDTIDAEVGISVALSGSAALKYAYRYQRTDFDDSNLDTIEDDDTFFTVTYGF